MKRITQPPSPTEFKTLDIPKFMSNRYTAPKTPVFSLSYVLQLIAWAELEYEDVVHYYVSLMDSKTVKHLKAHHTPVDVLATTLQFKNLVENLDSATWNTYPTHVQHFLVDVKQNYDTRNSKG